jgi:hypothetical protein
MKTHFVIDRYVTPSLAIATAFLLFIGGCEGESSHYSQPVSPVAEGTSRPEVESSAGSDPERPEGWIVRLDRPDPSTVIGSAETADVFFVNMSPGWHVTTKKAAIFYHPSSTGEGDYTVKAGIYLFDPGDRQREAYGILFGGADLDAASQSYGYFLLRNTGEFLIKSRGGSETTVVQDWTHSELVRTLPRGSTESALNELAIKVDGKQIHFILNGENVATHPLDSIPNQGVVGLRLNHGINVHVAELSVKSG